MKPELRRDPVTGRWIIVAPERAKRPHVFQRPTPTQPRRETCPFCPGNEAMTPPEVLSYRPHGAPHNAPGWWVRCVPNKFPALRPEGDLGRKGVGMYDRMNGVGAHEVLIESPHHDRSLADLDEGQVAEVIWAWRDRALELKKDPRIRYILIFKNHGAEAGASLDHPHCQIIALPIVPKRVQEEIAGAQQYHDYKERCVFCDMVHQELEDRRRLVLETEHFVSFMPYASRFAFETCILPKEHAANFHDIQKGGVTDLAVILRSTLARIKGALSDPPFNLILHTAPVGKAPLPHYHWHIEIMPTIARVAGFEWATGFHINTVAPEDAARYLGEGEARARVVTMGRDH